MRLDKAEADIYLAKLALSPIGNPTNDEMLIDLAAYHVQQGIEKALKHILSDICGFDETSRQYRTHNITTLIMLVETHCNFAVSDDLKLNAHDITSWEANSRYNDCMVTAKSDILNAIKLYDSLKKQIIEFEEKSHS